MRKIFAAVVIFSLFLSYHNVQAAAPQLQEYQNTVELDFPTSINFKAEFGSETAIVKIKLFYGSTQDTCGNVSGMALPDFTAGERVTVNWEWDMRQSGGEPPGATIWWQWEIVDELGNSTFTDRQEITRRLLACVIKPFVTAEWWEKTVDVVAQLAAEGRFYVMRFDRSGEIVNKLLSL